MSEPLDQELQKYELPTRDAFPWVTKTIAVLGVLLSLAHIWFNTFSTLPELWISATHFVGFAMICALWYPANIRWRDSKIALGVDVMIALAALACLIYIPLAEDALYARGVKFVTSDWVFAIMAIVIAIEMIRRTMGWFIPILIIVCLSYVVLWGKWAGGIFHFPGLSMETLLYRSFYSSEGMFGSISRISWSFVFMFILFGAFLVRSGVGDYIIDVSRAAAGKVIGGPGFIAVLASGLMGSVSGSSVANTVSTGVITIPMMKKAGFPSRFAAGVEAAASTGGQLMPPVMGAGAFIMASYTQIPYVDIVAVSFIPALIYFLSVAFFVRIEAKRSGVQKITTSDESFLKVLVSGWHNLIPLFVLVTLLVQGFTPTYAAGLSILSVIVASWFSKEHRMGIKEIIDALEQGAKNMATTAVLLVGIGLVINVISTTGIGNTFSLMIDNWSGGDLLTMLVLITLASLVLGMGLPVTAAYIVLGTLSAPALYKLIAESQLVDMIAAGQLPEQAKAIFMLAAPDKLELLNAPMALEKAKELVELVPADFLDTLLQQSLGLEAVGLALLSAHLIIFWLSQDSNVTPPVCLTAFAAATIAKTPPMRTGLTAWKIAKGLYLVPLLIAYTQLIDWDPMTVITIGFFAIVGTYAMIGAIEGFLEGPLNWPIRALLAVIGIALVWPNIPLLVRVVCVALFIAIFIYSGRRPNVAMKTASA
ncbi:TRAP transporter permease [Vibrio fluvialis]|jgi:TRAP transporter 4TM/12TM fusion protein|uniref:TRAP transporter permease n=1 Tax=Vibrio fluvialis TaxID=676 RepID=UPI000C222D73|nr:TRAP transporter permease [Vibrio fluvialis]HDM8035330.1 TRAP transporter permease [Vibrio fluvialis clinical-1]EKO3367993.1 TRAP transporter permease [Vibrio fluvialis]EKO3411286.1 TRAP transporter permease [Vibrio fluvialis]EKO3419846.1 TRAP transporter permease [Vibrio fluvialis]EKO3464583.1 TRAP transporter permease [Vibrio fluvialis]